MLAPNFYNKGKADPLFWLGLTVYQNPIVRYKKHSIDMLTGDIRHRLKTKPTRSLDQLRLHIRQQGLAYKTEQTYVYWVKRFIYFHNKQYSKNLGSVDVEAFLSHLAVNLFCSVNTQKIALNALVYLYRRCMGVVIGDLSFSPARAPRRLPVVFSQ